MDENMSLAFKEAMGDYLYNKWIDAGNRLDSGEINYDEYVRIMSEDNYDVDFSGKERRVTIINHDTNETRTAYF